MNLKKFMRRPKGDRETTRTVAHSFDYNPILAGVFIGTNACCADHLCPILLEQNIVADISLEEERIDAPKGAKFFLWLPVKNHAAPSQDQLETGVAMIDHFVRKKIQVYVHCKNGHGRAPTLVAAYLINRGMTLIHALEHIKSRRPVVHLNSAQIKALKTYARNVHRRH